MSENTLYDDLKALGLPMDSHESDLYIRFRAEACAIIRKHGYVYTTFTSETDGKLWIDVPFAFQPWWDARRRKAQ